MQFRTIIVSLFIVSASYNYAASQNNSQLPGKFSLSESGCLTNDAFTEICKNWSGDQDGSGYSGDPVCVTIETKTLSRSKKELTGTFLGHSGAWAEDIYVVVDFSSGTLPKGIKKGDTVAIKGTMPSHNELYNNVVDFCQIQVEATSVDVDGF